MKINYEFTKKEYLNILNDVTEIHNFLIKGNYRSAFFKLGETKIELLQSTNSDGVIAKFIEKKGEGIHHLAFDTDNILAEVERLKKAGFTLLNETPKEGADNKLVCFLHPKSTNGVLIELCQEKK